MARRRKRDGGWLRVTPPDEPPQRIFGVLYVPLDPDGPPMTQRELRMMNDDAISGDWLRRGRQRQPGRGPAFPKR